MENLRADNEDLSQQQIWSMIRYLDPELRCRAKKRPVLIPVVTFLVFWAIFFVAMYGISIRAGCAMPRLQLNEKVKPWRIVPEIYRFTHAKGFSGMGRNRKVFSAYLKTRQELERKAKRTNQSFPV